MKRFVHPWITAMGALAVVLFGPSIASAQYPIQNFTTTTDSLAGVTAGDAITIGGSVFGGTISYTGGFATTATGVDNTVADGGYTGNVLWLGGATVRTYCFQLTGDLNKGSNITTKIETIPPSGGVGTGYVADSSAAAERAAYVVATFGEAPGASASVQTAVQLAVWSIMYQYGNTAQGDVTVGSTFNASPTVTGSTPNAAIDTALANTYLAASWNGGSVLTANGYVIRQNVLFTDTTTVSSAGQDLIYAATVPEPSSLAIAGLGALGFLGYGLRRRKALGA